MSLCPILLSLFPVSHSFWLASSHYSVEIYHRRSIRSTAPTLPLFACGFTAISLLFASDFVCIWLNLSLPLFASDITSIYLCLHLTLLLFAFVHIQLGLPLPLFASDFLLICLGLLPILSSFAFVCIWLSPHSFWKFNFASIFLCSDLTSLIFALIGFSASNMAELWFCPHRTLFYQ